MEEVCWKLKGENTGDKAFFGELYEKDFDSARAFCGFIPEVPKTIRGIKTMGYRLVLAENPIFPKVTTDSRIGWEELGPSAFELYTNRN